MNSIEEQLQNNVEKGLADNGWDARTYARVFDALSKDDRSMKFSSKWTDAIITKVLLKQKREKRKDVLWLAFGLLFIICGFIVAVLATGFSFDLGFLKKMRPYSGLFIFGIAFVILLNWMEKKFLNRDRGLKV